jgi:hypothetical protein
MTDAQQAEHYLRQRADDELAAAVAGAQAPAAADEASPRACLQRATELAGVLSAVGAVPEPAAFSVLGELRSALERRGLLDAEPDEESEPPAARVPETVRAFPAGLTASCAVEGFPEPMRFRLGALVTDGQRARLTTRAAYADPKLTGPRWFHHGPDPLMALWGGRLTATDDLGGRYEDTGGSWGGNHHDGGRFHWDGWIGLDPVPPQEARWLEVTLAGRALPRIPLRRQSEPATTVAALEEAGAASRYLDARTLTLLAGAPDFRFRSLSVVTTAEVLLAAGVLPTGSPPLGRLAAAARRAGLALTGPLSAIPAAPLPADWAVLAASAGAACGASGVVFAAAVLPAVEGATCVITEVTSRPDISVFRVFAPCWPRSWLHGMPQIDDRYHWDARDDLGHRYATSAFLGVGQGGTAEFPLRLHPPVSPQATELEITLAGRTAQASVRIPLDWRADDWHSDLPDWQITR